MKVAKHERMGFEPVVAVIGLGLSYLIAILSRESIDSGSLSPWLLCSAHF